MFGFGFRRHTNRLQYKFESFCGAKCRAEIALMNIAVRVEAYVLEPCLEHLGLGPRQAFGPNAEGVQDPQA
jgi:hypothetical protein